MSSPDAPSDETLAAAAAAGDRAALDALLERHLDRIHAVCRRVLPNREDALDATQEALIAVSRRIGSYDERARFTTWLYRVTTNAAIDEARRKSRRPTPMETLPEPAPPSDMGAGVADRIDVSVALEQIPEEFRTAVALRDLGDLDYSQIADILGIPPGTVRSRISRGRALLAALLATGDGNQTPGPARPTSMT